MYADFCGVILDLVIDILYLFSHKVPQLRGKRLKELSPILDSVLRKDFKYNHVFLAPFHRGDWGSWEGNGIRKQWG